MKERLCNDYPHACSCHSGPIEVVKNLFCGNADEALIMVDAPIVIDTLIPLHDLSPSIWNKGFRGEIIYYPISDYGTLPSDVLNDLVLKVLNRLHLNKKVGLFCLGGHGRTGYVAAVILGKLGHHDPVQFLRAKYCQRAVESNTQIEHIAEILGKPELVEKYCNQYSILSRSLPAYYAPKRKRRCYECVYFSCLGCVLKDDYIICGDDAACVSFEE